MKTWIRMLVVGFLLSLFTYAIRADVPGPNGGHHGGVIQLPPQFQAVPAPPASVPFRLEAGPAIEESHLRLPRTLVDSLRSAALTGNGSGRADAGDPNIPYPTIIAGIALSLSLCFGGWCLARSHRRLALASLTTVAAIMTVAGISCIHRDSIKPESPMRMTCSKSCPQLIDGQVLLETKDADDVQLTLNSDELQKFSNPPTPAHHGLSMPIDLSLEVSKELRKRELKGIVCMEIRADDNADDVVLLMPRRLLKDHLPGPARHGELMPSKRGILDSLGMSGTAMALSLCLAVGGLGLLGRGGTKTWLIVLLVAGAVSFGIGSAVVWADPPTTPPISVTQPPPKRKPQPEPDPETRAFSSQVRVQVVDTDGPIVLTLNRELLKKLQATPSWKPEWDRRQ